MFGTVDATGKHGEGQSGMEAEVEERMPSFPAYPDGTVEDFTLKTVGLEIPPLSVMGTVGSR